MFFDLNLTTKYPLSFHEGIRIKQYRHCQLKVAVQLCSLISTTDAKALGVKFSSFA